MATSSRVRLLEVDPDLGRFVPDDEQPLASGLIVPVLAIARDEESVVSRIEEAGAFGAIVLDGMVFDELRVADQIGTCLLGPGDIVWTAGGSPPMVAGEGRCRAAAATRLALLDEQVLLASRRWPGLVVGLARRVSQQRDRLVAQLVICQLPRVDQRLLAMMWLLAESWGRVTSSGTTVPLALTHDALGALIGARRPTVTLALRELSERGAIARQNSGWLLLEPSPKPSGSVETPSRPALIAQPESSWLVSASELGGRRLSAPELFDAYQALRETVSALHDRHVHTAAQFEQELSRLASSRKRCAANRQRVSGQRLRRSPAPSA